MLRHVLHPPQSFVLPLAVSIFALTASSANATDELLSQLKTRCSKCHQGDHHEGSLQITSRQSLLEGGDSGPAIVSGSATESLLFQRVAAGEMPPKHPLDAREIDEIRAWIDALPHGKFETIDGASQACSVPEVMTRVFFTHCISCHGKGKQESGLDLRTPEAIRRGGKSGPGVTPGDPEGSLIIRRLKADEMPPKTDVWGDSNYVRRVSPDEIQLVRQWIVAGAPDEETVAEAGASPPPARSEFWSFQPVKRPAIPRVDHDQDVITPIDSFILAKLEKYGLGLSPPAEKLQLLRRAAFDLTGLPPTPAEVTEYLADNRADSYERLVDRLLASPRYGERWAQHWLDGAGYADSHGKIDRDQFRPYMWRYRDYVIRSLNDDKPYDRFLTEQIAGDELAANGKLASDAEQVEAFTATGFLLSAADATDEAAFNSVPQRMGVVSEQIEIFTSSVMGLTLECARCHNHKFDPITQEDYYRFFAIFQSAMDPYDWRIASQVYYPKKIPLDRRYQRYIYLATDSESPELARWNREVERRSAALEAKLNALVDEEKESQRAAGGGAAASLDADQLAAQDPPFKERLEKARAEVNAVKQQRITSGVIDGLRDVGGEPTPVYLLRRGELNTPINRVAPGVPRVFDAVAARYQVEPSPAGGSSGNRLALAKWLTDASHPLTARVLVNRVWQHHFGQGLVATPGNFGAKGARPSHPELLDWLASEFVSNGWSLKKLHRLIMTSAVYRQTSRVSPEFAADADDVLLSHFPLQRLDGHSVRDAILAVSGQLDLTPYGPPEAVERTPDGEVVDSSVGGSRRRSIYLRKMRLMPLTMVDQFDGPDMVPNCMARVQSNVPTQALQLYNSDLVRGAAAALAEVVAQERGHNEEVVPAIYVRAYGRPPSPEELRLALVDLAALRAAWAANGPAGPSQQDPNADAEDKALATFCHAILNSPEFIYVD